jgi:ATP/ADP translocase
MSSASAAVAVMPTRLQASRSGVSKRVIVICLMVWLAKVARIQEAFWKEFGQPNQKLG